MKLSRSFLVGLTSEYFVDLPVRMCVKSRHGGFEVSASSKRRRHLYVRWLPAQISHADLSGAIRYLHGQITHGEKLPR